MKNTHLEEANQRMRKSFDMLDQQLLALGNSNLNAIDSIKIDYYGSKTPLNQMATIAAPYGGKVVIHPYDNSMLDEIKRVILSANLGFGVYKDGRCVAVVAPRISSEQREQLCKHVAHLGEEAKIAIRSIRKDTRKHLEKSELPEDDLHKAFDKLQVMTDEAIDRVDFLVKNKQAKLME